MRRLSLKKAAVLTTSIGALILTSVGAGLLGLWGQRGVFWETQQILLQNDQAVLGRVIREVETTLTDHAEGLTRHGDLVKAFAQRQVEILEEFAVPVFNRLSKQGLLSRLRFFTSEGRLFFEAHGATTGGDAWHLVQEVLSQKKRVTRLELDQGEPVLSVALPVYAHGELVGVLQAGLGLSKIVHMLRGVLGSQVGLFTLREEVTLQSATDPELLTALAGLLPLKGSRVQAARETRHLGGLTYAVSLLPVEAEPGRSVGIFVSASDVTALGQAMTRTAVLVGAATLIGVLVASLITSISLIRRLRRLGQTVDLLEDIAQGKADLTRRLSVEVQDEIGSLAMSANRMMEWMEEMVTVADRIGGGDLTVRVRPRSDRDVMGQALNRMVEQLQKLPEAQERAQEQAALNAIAMATSQSLHLEELLQIALNKVLEITGRERGYILLKDQATGKLTLAAEQGISQEYADAILHHLTPGGKSDQVFESGEPLIINHPEGTILREETRRQGNTCIGWFPLKARGKVVGILNVSTGRSILFTQREAQILQTTGNIIGVALENARLFEQTKKQAVELERASKVKDDFLGFVSHELRTPVNAVIGYAGMIRDKMLGEISPEQERTLGKVIGRSKDLLDMINGLLEATRIEAGAVKVKTDEIRLCRFLDQLRSSYDVPLGKGLTLKWDYPSDLPVVKTDSEKLKHILQNLINNAIKYTDRGEVRVSTRITAGNKQQAEGARRAVPVLTPSASRLMPKWVEFQVSDTGVGIPKESMPFIFEMFCQVGGSSDGARGGVGLGLHIVKRFTELLGGEIEVESELGKGSTFTVTIPCEGYQSEVSEEPSGAGAGAANQLWEPRSAKGNRGDSDQSGVDKKGS